MNNYLTKVAQFNESHTANLMKGILENKSIFVKLQGEHTSNVLPIMDNVIYMTVFQNDINKALPILKKFKEKFDFVVLVDLV